MPVDSHGEQPQCCTVGPYVLTLLAAADTASPIMMKITLKTSCAGQPQKDIPVNPNRFVDFIQNMEVCPSIGPGSRLSLHALFGAQGSCSSLTSALLLSPQPWSCPSGWVEGVRCTSKYVCPWVKVDAAGRNDIVGSCQRVLLGGRLKDACCISPRLPRSAPVQSTAAGQANSRTQYSTAPGLTGSPSSSKTHIKWMRLLSLCSACAGFGSASFLVDSRYMLFSEVCRSAKRLPLHPDGSVAGTQVFNVRRTPPPKHDRGALTNMARAHITTSYKYSQMLGVAKLNASLWTLGFRTMKNLSPLPQFAVKDSHLVRCSSSMQHTFGQT